MCVFEEGGERAEVGFINHFLWQFPDDEEDVTPSKARPERRPVEEGQSRNGLIIPNYQNKLCTCVGGLLLYKIIIGLHLSIVFFRLASFNFFVSSLT